MYSWAGSSFFSKGEVCKPSMECTNCITEKQSQQLLVQKATINLWAIKRREGRQYCPEQKEKKIYVGWSSKELVLDSSLLDCTWFYILLWDCLITSNVVT